MFMTPANFARPRCPTPMFLDAKKLSCSPQKLNLCALYLKNKICSNTSTLKKDTLGEEGLQNPSWNPDLLQELCDHTCTAGTKENERLQQEQRCQ